MNRRLDLDGETRAVRALAALAQTSRLRVFRLLVGAGPDGLCPGQIAGALGVSATLLSFHLKELHACGLVTQKREGRFMRYHADMTAMQQLMEFLTAHCCQGEPCIEMPMAGCFAPAS
ncbi:MAG: metalloregulator ArsR/SmtB family transcription factor [Burkholderiales bacterium]|nr:metalloregulator ArsR/SmtB family transcription factor [Burkholderiales bacterium]